MLAAGSHRDPALTLALCRELPKCELHAHINGCIRDSTLNELCRLSTDPVARRFVVPPAEDRSLMQCFEMFGIIHKAVRTLEAVTRVVAEVVEDFAADNVWYLELRCVGRRHAQQTLPPARLRALCPGCRTTPRVGCLATNGAVATRADYVRAVIDSVRSAEVASGGSIVVRLLLSVDRSGTIEEAEETIHLAAAFQESDGIVVGVDFSGRLALPPPPAACGPDECFADRRQPEQRQVC
jgi:adenosine deaminase